MGRGVVEWLVCGSANKKTIWWMPKSSTHKLASLSARPLYIRLQPLLACSVTCDQMAILFFEYLAILNNENLPKV